MSKAGCKGNNGENWLLRPGTSSQSRGYSSKWLIWLVCREPLDFLDIYTTLSSMEIYTVRVLSTGGGRGEASPPKIPASPPKGLPVIIHIVQELLFMPNNDRVYHTRVEI